MTHLVGPHLNMHGKCKPKLGAKALKSAAEHLAWLKAQGLDPETVKKRTANIKVPVVKRPDLKTKSNAPLSHGVGNGYVRGVMANLHKESPEVQREILDKASRTAPLYNKGGLQYVTPGEDVKSIGSRSRRP